MKTVAICTGGQSAEHRESIKAARILYKHLGNLLDKYNFEYFYLTTKNQWATKKASEAMIKGKLPMDSSYTRNFNYIDDDRITEFKNVDVIYSTMMGDCGENGNIMGLADLFNKPIIGCGILASSLCQNKYLSKLIAKLAGINIVDYLYVNANDSLSEIVPKIKKI